MITFKNYLKENSEETEIFKNYLEDVAKNYKAKISNVKLSRKNLKFDIEIDSPNTKSFDAHSDTSKKDGIEKIGRNVAKLLKIAKDPWGDVKVKNNGTKFEKNRYSQFTLVDRTPIKLTITIPKTNLEDISSTDNKNIQKFVKEKLDYFKKNRKNPKVFKELLKDLFSSDEKSKLIDNLDIKLVKVDNIPEFKNKNAFLISTKNKSEQYLKLLSNIHDMYFSTFLQKDKNNSYYVEILKKFFEDNFKPYVKEIPDTRDSFNLYTNSSIYVIIL